MSRRKRSYGLGFDVFAFTLKAIVWGSVLIFCLGVVLVSCEAFGRGLAGAAGDARAAGVTVGAAKETTSELRAEMLAQTLDAEGFEVRRVYGLEGWPATKDVFVRSGGAFVFPAQASGPEPDPVDLPGATMLSPTEEAVGGEHPAPLVGDRWARENPGAVAALEETTRELDAREFSAMVSAVDSGESLVVAEVYEWRARHVLPPAPGVRPPVGEPTTEGVRV